MYVFLSYAFLFYYTSDGLMHLSFTSNIKLPPTTAMHVHVLVLAVLLYMYMDVHALVPESEYS